MKNFIVLFLLIASVSITQATVRTVNMVGLVFAPETLNAQLGDTVRWKNTDIRIHTSTSGINGTANNIWNSGNMAQGDSFQFAFTSAGNFPYFCTYHYLTGMVGLIIVNASDIKEGAQIKKPISVTQNYPNPFTNSTVISYEITVPGKVEIKIFDAVGKTVKNLTNENLVAGMYNTQWDGTNNKNQAMQNGLYFYRINLNGMNYTGKILKTG